MLSEFWWWGHRSVYIKITDCPLNLFALHFETMCYHITDTNVIMFSYSELISLSLSLSQGPPGPPGPPGRPGRIVGLNGVSFHLWLYISPICYFQLVDRDDNNGQEEEEEDDDDDKQPTLNIAIPERLVSQTGAGHCLKRAPNAFEWQKTYFD